MNLLLFPLLLLGFCQCVFTEDSCPVVSAPVGKFKGALLQNTNGKPIFSYRGIRYAEAPVKELRFKAPVPVQKHEGVYNAEEDGPVCPQDSKSLKDPTSEDCLLLNVYTTKLPDGAENPKRPVIIFLHYGGYYYTSGRSNILGPQYLLNEDIVLVTLNYRLGSLGFLSTGDEEAIGNNGLKDQVVAMKWVKANIAAFGGHPDDVTIFGYSAGAMSVTLHLVSPMSDGLFHKAIIGSSSALGNIPFGRSQLYIAKKQARAVGCPVDTTAKMVKCLREVPAEKMGNTYLDLFDITGQGWVWKPVVEKDFGQERFLTDHPVKLIREGKFRKVPILGGITKDEEGALAPILLQNKTIMQKINGGWDTYAPIVFFYERNTEHSKELSAAFKSFYFDGNELTATHESSFAQFVADGDTGYAVNKAVKLMAEHSDQPVHYYRFSYQGKYSSIYTPESNNTVPYGVVHCDDLIYLFYNPSIAPLFRVHDVEYRIVEKLTTLWTNFAKHGKPIVEKCGKLDYAEWPVFELKNQKYMDIGEDLVVKEKLYNDRYTLWDKLFPESKDHVLDIDY